MRLFREFNLKLKIETCIRLFIIRFNSLLYFCIHMDKVRMEIFKFRNSIQKTIQRPFGHVPSSNLTIFIKNFKQNSYMICIQSSKYEFLDITI